MGRDSYTAQYEEKEMNGNYIVDTYEKLLNIQERKPKLYCSSCDCKGYHSCLVCDSEIDDSPTCQKHEGLCFKHWSEKE